MTLPKPLSSRERSELLMQHLDAVANDPDYWSPFAKPFNEPIEDEAPEPTTAEYYFGYGVGPNNAPSLEAVKTWTEGDERRFDTFTIAEFDDFADADDLEAELETLHKEAGLEAAMVKRRDWKRRWSWRRTWRQPIAISILSAMIRASSSRTMRRPTRSPPVASGS